MFDKCKRNLKRLVYAVIVLLVLAGRVKEVQGAIFFENIPVTTAEGDQTYPVIWDNYIVWKGAENEAYDIEQQKIVEMPGLIIDGVPAIWDNKVIWSVANGYYDILLQQIVYPEGLSVGKLPAIHNNKVVWSNSGGYYDIDLEQMVYPLGLSVGYAPDIFEDKIVWSYSKGYYNISLQQMVYPEGLNIYIAPAIYRARIVYLGSGYYDIDLQQYVSLGLHIWGEPDIFEDRIVWNNYDAVPPAIVDIFTWDPVCKKRQITDSGCAYGAQIYDDIIVWVDERNGNRDIYMAKITGCCGDPNHPYPVGDLNQDCRVDLLDLAILASHWMEDNTPVNSNSVVKDGIKYYMQTDKSVYHSGENVHMLYRVTNLTEGPVEVGEILCGGAPHFAITDDDNADIWQYFRVIPPCGYKMLCLEPYEHKDLEKVWNMINDNGTLSPHDDYPVSHGEYKVTGELELDGWYERVPVSVFIVIIP